MSTSLSLTYTRIGAILREIGMVSAEKTHSVLEGIAHYANDEQTQALHEHLGLTFPASGS